MSTILKQTTHVLSLSLACTIFSDCVVGISGDFDVIETFTFDNDGDDDDDIMPTA